MDSEDDVPLRKRTNGVKSTALISEKVDKDMERSNLSEGNFEPGISLRMGPVVEMGVEEAPQTNGANGKRKARTNGTTYKEANGSEDEDMPLSKRLKRTAGAPKKSNSDSESGMSDVPLIMRVKKPPKASGIQELAKEKAKIEQRAANEAKIIRAHETKSISKSSVKIEDHDDEDIPLAKKPRKSAGIEKKTSSRKAKAEDSDDDVTLKSKVSTSKKPRVKTEPLIVAKKRKGKAQQEVEVDEEAEAEEEEYRWWEDPTKGDGTKKWTTLEHNGVTFPPPYELLPKNVKLKYDGVPVSLEPDAEEVATFYGSMLNSTVNIEKPTFNKNFFEDFKTVLDKTGHAKDKDGKKIKIKTFDKCDFRPIFEWFDSERAKKKALSKDEKKALKTEKDKADAPFQYCTWDGRKQKVGNFRVEPPGLFRGRGDHPKTGRVKQRAVPEQITINIGKEATVPAPPEGHQWKEIKHDNEGTWLAMWQENINGAYKYVMLAANSDVKGQSDYKKFEKARELKKHIDHIRSDYQQNLKNKVMADRQLATAVYLIDQFALRAGNEKGEDEADTVGCCSLKFEHITLKPPQTVIFDFLGKDSIRFYNEVEVDPQVFKNLRIFKQNKKDGDEVFDRLNTSGLNKHLSGYMQGLSAKVFRTYNASWTMSNLLKEMKSTGSIPEKIMDYNAANRKVAILCNHKRTVAAGHDGQMEKMQERINGLRYQQWRLKQMELDIDPKIKKKKGAEYFELPEDITEEWVKEHQAALVAEQRSKIEKKFEKDNEKLRGEGQKEMKHKELEERLETADELENKFKKENKSKKVEAEGKGPTVEKCEQNIDKLTQRIETMKVQAMDKEENKEVALGTSKINYIDPRLTVVFAKKFNVPIERFFSKTLREKFDWAVKSVDEDWEF